MSETIYQPKTIEEIFHQNLTRERRFLLSEINEAYIKAIVAIHDLQKSKKTLCKIVGYIDSFQPGDVIPTCAGNIEIPNNYYKKLAKNRRGWVFYDQETTGDKGIIRIAYPDQNYLRWICQTIQSRF